MFLSTVLNDKLFGLFSAVSIPFAPLQAAQCHQAPLLFQAPMSLDVRGVLFFLIRCAIADRFIF